MLDEMGGQRNCVDFHGVTVKDSVKQQCVSIHQYLR